VTDDKWVQLSVRFQFLEPRESTNLPAHGYDLP